MLNQLILRLICAAISAIFISFFGPYISSKLGVPRILHDSRFSGSDQKRDHQRRGRQRKQNHFEPTDSKAIDASKRLRKDSRSRHSSSNNQRSQSQSGVERSRCKRLSEMKGQIKSQRQCHNRNGRNLPDANVKDRAFSERRYK
jgi:hypothetical protein